MKALETTEMAMAAKAEIPIPAEQSPKEKVIVTVKIVILALAAAAVISAVNVINPLISIGLALLCALMLYMTTKPVYSIILLILATPFSATSLFDSQIAGIPGMKAANLLAMAAVGFLIMKKKPARLSGEDQVFIYGLLILFTAAILRSTAYIGETYSMIWSDQYSLMRYLLSNLIKPLLIFLPFILISIFVRSTEEIHKIILSLLFSIFLLSAAVLVLYAFFTPNKLNFEEVRVGFSQVLGMHNNNLADFYIAVYPILLAYAISKKSWFWGVGVFMSLAAIGVIYSRSAYFVVIVCTFAFFILSHRTKLLPWVGAASLVSVFFIPRSIIERALTGLSNNDISAISAGRVDRIWMPLLEEFMDKPLNLIIGAGRYAIMGSDSFKSGAILQVGHAHSMYLDLLLDAGLIGLLFFLVFFFRFLMRFIRTHRFVEDRLFLDILIGIEISVVAFMVRGITDSFFFPALTNAFLWINLGLGVSITYLARAEKAGERYETGSYDQ